MKKLILGTIILGVALCLSSPAFARYTHGYYRSNGTYVNGYHNPCLAISV